jgi:3-(3-hydroxy-phenyl)propionate hydroxylase
MPRTGRLGARGGNSGVQDADNLCGSSILRGLALERLLDSYDAERVAAADENLLNTTRSTDFIAPKSAISRAFRDSVLALAETEPFARRLVNSGRLTVATCYDGSSLNGPDGFSPGECPQARPGAAALDAPLGDRWLLHSLGEGFTGVWFTADGSVPDEVTRTQAALAQRELPVAAIVISDATACARYGAAREPAFYLFRPDGHVAARWRQPSLTAVEARRARDGAGIVGCVTASADTTQVAGAAGGGSSLRSTHPTRTITRDTPMPLKRDPNVADPDGLYAAIIDAHADLTEAESVALNARLVLLLANHIGDPAVLAEALATARKSVGK